MLDMNPRQKRTVLIMAVVTVLVFVGAIIASVAGSGDEPITAEDTTTTSIVPNSTTTEPTTTASTSTTTNEDQTSSTTTSSTTTTTTSTTTTTTVPATVVLRGDGFGLTMPDRRPEVLAFGTEAEAALEVLVTTLGPPDEDTGWIPSFSGFGTCPGEQVRVIRWVTLWAYLTDGGTEWRNDGVPHLFSYIYALSPTETRSLDLLTEAGIGLGDTVKALRDAYGDTVEIAYEEFIDGYLYTIDLPPPARLWGGLTGDGNKDLITSVDGGRGCGE